MLELTQYNSLGSLNDSLFILNLLNSTKKGRMKEIVDYCKNSISFSRIPPSGPISLLQYIDFIENDVDGLHLTNLGERAVQIKQREELMEYMASTLLNRMKTDENLNEMMTGLIIQYDHIDDVFLINNSSIPLKYAVIKKLLFELGIIKQRPPPESHVLSIEGLYGELIKENVIERRRKQSLQQLLLHKEILEKQGLIAEEFVLAYEMKRLSGHNRLSLVKIISDVDVGAGYDIASFNATNSERLDRFIEVKSYSNALSFHWSRNEIDVARKKENSYFLYIVDSNKIDDQEYMPMIISNPCNVLFSSPEWKVENDGLLITKINAPNTISAQSDISSSN